MEFAYMKNVIIIGTGGHAKVIADIVLCAGDRLVGFLTSDRDKKEFLGYPVLGQEADYCKFPDCSFIIAIGDNRARERIAGAMPGADWYTAIHPSAVISRLGVRIGEGSAIMANAVVNPCAQIGAHCIINSSAVVEHDNVTGDFSHISVGAKLAGTVSVGKRCLIGVGSCVREKVCITGGCVIGAGAAVVDDITEPGVYVGVPARKMK